jgi:hypothetical protein
MRLAQSLVFAAVLLTVIAWLRGPEYDESYSIFLTAGDPRPAWPAGVFSPEQVRAHYQGQTSFGAIVQNLRVGDVHPPLYFWALKLWRAAFGPGWFTARLLSVIFATAALAALAWAAALAEIPPAPAVLIATLFYGFAYTGIVARGFALAQFLNVLGVACVLGESKRFLFEKRTTSLPALAIPNRYALSAAAGLAFGAASFTNYLASFTAIASILWLARKSLKSSAVTAICFAVFLPADFYVFAAQHNSRPGQFSHFSLGAALPRLAKDCGAAVFGGLPVYAGRAGPVAGLALLGLFAACIGAIVKTRPPYCGLFAGAALATPVGLLALGAVFNTVPIEIRYCAFGLPYLALLLAAALPVRLRGVLLAVQCAAIAGLALAPATMQPQQAAARQVAALATPQTLSLIPFGNDGVGIPGPFIDAAPDGLRIQLIRPGTPPVITAPRVILATIRADDSSRAAVTNTLHYLAANKCWQPGPATALTRVFTNRCADQ